MGVADLKKRFVLSLVMLGFSLTFFVFASWSWLTQLFEENVTATVGFVEVDVYAYFWNGTTQIPAELVVIDYLAPGDEDDVTKPGVYLIDITSNSADNFFDDFRLYIDVSSSVDTYFRVKIYEQLTLSYENYEGTITELSILNPDYMPFDYALTNWHDNRIIDNYMYYKLPIKRVNETTPLEIGMITQYSLAPFSIYSPGYSLQIAFSIEAVQADGGPENVWSLPTPPWGGSWDHFTILIQTTTLRKFRPPIHIPSPFPKKA